MSSVIAFAGLSGHAALAKETIVIDLVDEPQSLDPHLHANNSALYTYGNMFDNLLTRDNAGKIIPNIATKWSQLSDTEIEFTIRDDVTFHDGSPLTAEDVAFSIQRIIDPAYGSDWISTFAAIAGAEATGPNTVKVTTKTVYPLTLGMMTKLPVVPKAVVEKVGDEAFNLSPVGSGPYKFVAWNRGVSVDMAAYDGYWGEKPEFPKAEFRIVPDAATRVADLQTGAADLIVTLTPDLAVQIQAEPGLKVETVATERMAYLKLNLEAKPFDDIRVREAIASAIDREGLVQGLLLGIGGVESEQLIAPSSFGSDPNPPAFPAYDPDHARELVKEVSPDGPIPMTLVNRPPYSQSVAEAVQQMLIDVGFDATLEVKEGGTWYQQVTGDPAQHPDGYFINMSCSCGDADGLFTLVFGKGANFAKATGATDETEALLVKGRTTLDEGERMEAYEAMADWVAETLPIIPMYQVSQIYAMNEKLSFTPTPNETMFINRMAWSE
ncbi:hypothetical protein JCR33_13960 [Acuticoccus sp. 2012]|uniref:Solute-binding protein family 5 domain-containing protein n=1 Tax=Acuticoccus mangrovi TaxID=2796142 RepID=A0A934IMX9_9HYPH|nr:ABC transporter substrate-binding protein [Acuticoccus mangrovi]MBJ3776807.1 hypothetical protein [Acuticoccus mangrovi]